jgi:subtilisin family serine protease/subtilisin-like proprotein convertase family protein
MLDKLEQLDYVRSLSTSSPGTQSLAPNSGTVLSAGELIDPLQTSSNFFRASSYTAPVAVESSDNFSSKNPTAGTAFNNFNRLSISTDYIPNEVIVKFKSGVNQANIQAIRSNIEASVVKRTQITGAELWEIKGSDIANAIRQYSQDSRIEYIEPNYKINVTAIPNDPSFSSLWGLNNTGQGGGTPDADIDAAEAWNIQTGNNVLVGVIDTGVDYNHPDLAANIWTNPGEIAGDGIDNDGNGYVDDIHGYDFFNNDSDPMDDVGHGTHVAGTIAGSGNNGVGVTGVSWSSKIMALKFMGPNGGTTYDAIRAINYATQMGAKITNNSWAGGGFSQGLYDAIAAARNAGSLFIAAAGNSGNNNDSTATYPASYDLDNIIAVAATDRNDQLASFSNYGATSVDIGAPGVDILSTTPNNTYSTYDGTSMAAPHVSGVASLVWAQNPGMTYAQVKERILTTGDPITSLQGKTLTGRRLNAYNALTGNVPLAGGIYGNAWKDVNANGGRDAGEPGLQNWTIFQDRNNNGVLDTGTPGNVINSGDIPKSIPDLGTVNSTLTVSGLTGTISDVNVNLNISHTWDADLDVFLVSPIGTRVELFTDVGGDGDNFTNTTLDDEATTAIASAAAPFTGSFRPEGLLSNFDGQDPNGTWKLELTDDTGTDVGTINSWSLTFNSVTAEASTLTNANGDYSFTNLATGNYIIREVLQGGWTPTTSNAYNVSWNYGDVITNRDFGNLDKPIITIAASDASAAEPSDPGQFTITRSGNTGTALTVNYSLAGTATNGSDYNNLTGSVVIPVGSTTATINITPIDDTLVEGNETVVVNLSSDSAYTIGNANSATVAIADNDNAAPLSTVTIKATDATAAEVASGTANPGKFTVTRTGDTSTALSVNYSMSGTATNGSDYSNLTGSVLIPVGSTTATIDVNVNNDTLLEADETVIATLTANSAYNLGTAKTGTVTILDDDKTRVSITATDASAAEVATGLPANPGVFTFTRTGSTDTALTVNYTVGGTATKGTDYENPSTSVVIPIGATSVTLPINVVDDNLTEANETAIVTLTANSAYNLGTTKTATVTIADNEPVVTVTATDAIAQETTTGLPANPGEFTFTRTGATDTELTLNYTVGGTATKGTDYNNLTGSIVIPIGASSVTLPVNVIDDNLTEANETAIVTLTANSAYNLGTANTATVTIADNEPVVTVTATDAIAQETTTGLPANPGVFTFTRTGSTDTELTLNYTVGGTATKGTDYNNLTGSIVIPIGASSVTLPINVVDDTLGEADERAIVTLTANSAYNLGTAKTATVTILDDDRPRVTVTATDASAAETTTGLPANPGVFTFTRTGATDTELSVSYTLTGTASNGNDYNSLPTSVVIPIGQSSVTVLLSPIDDLLDEPNETAIASLTLKPEYNIGTFTGTAKTAVVTILDNDP